MNILITGGSGFLGGALVNHLARKGFNLFVLVRKSSNLQRIEKNIPSVNILEFVDFDSMQSAIVDIKPKIVIHTACVYGRGKESLTDLLDANVLLGLKVISALTKAKIKSTFINTNSVLSRDASNYAASKWLFSEIAKCLSSSDVNPVKYIEVQLQHMYGPGDDLTKFTSHVLHGCLNNISELELTLGQQKRDFIYIDDVVTAYETIIQNLDYFSTKECVDLGFGYAPTVREFVEKVKLMTNSKTKLLFGALDYRENEPMHCQASIEKLNSLGWTPKYDLERGIEKFISKESF